MTQNGMFQNGRPGETALGHGALGGAIFTSSLLQASSDQRLRRSWTTLSSFGLQAVAMGLLLMLPLVRPDRIPLLHRLATPISLGQPLPEAPQTPARGGSPALAPSNLVPPRFMQPSRIPTTTALTADVPQEPFGSAGPGGPTVGVAGAGAPDGILLTGGGTRPVLATPPTPVPHAIRVSHMSEGSLTYKVQPVYPPVARAARVEGPVVLAALISRDGTIENLRVLKGHPMLVRAAVEAVSQWRYRPYILNSEPVEVETQITVNFFLAH